METPSSMGLAFNEMASMVSLGRYILLYIWRASYGQLWVRGKHESPGWELAWHIPPWSIRTGAGRRVEKQGGEVTKGLGELGK